MYFGLGRGMSFSSRIGFHSPSVSYTKVPHHGSHHSQFEPSFCISSGSGMLPHSESVIIFP